MINNYIRISDSELLFLIAQGNIGAKRILDKRYHEYAKKIVKKYLETHDSYGYTFDDFLNAAMSGYCDARNKFDYELSKGFYPYFRIWATSEMKRLSEEGSRFYLHENPNKFLSLDITYNKNEDEMVLAEMYGENDDGIMNQITHNELYDLINDEKNGLSKKERIICWMCLLKHNEKEIREVLNVGYRKYNQLLKNIHTKLKRRITDIVK